MAPARAAAAAAVLLGVAAAQNVPSDFQDKDWGVKACSNTQDQGCCCSNDKRQNAGATCTATELMLCAVKEWGDTTDGQLRAKQAKLESNATQLWIIICGALVVFMQCGFAMLEAGSVRTRNTQNIIFKNVIDICIAALGFFTVGYAFAFGDGTKAGGDAGRFIGATNFFLMREDEDESGQHLWFFQFAFAATASTIVSGSVAERTKLNAYFIYSVVLTTFVYPVVVHWVWSAHGWLSAFAPGDENFGPNGMIDFAGSGVVHTVGGFAGLMGAIVVGPRSGRFIEEKDSHGQITYGEPTVMRGQSTMLSCLGAMILWFGWYGFNCGSTLSFDGNNAGKIAVCTTLGAGAGGLTTTFLSKLHLGYFAVDAGLNGMLAGLVSVTASCAVVDEWAALVIGFLGGVLYYLAAELLLRLHIDDPLNAWPVHGVCGVWGCLAVGIFGQSRNIHRVYGEGAHGDAVATGEQFAVQLLGVSAIVGWTVVLSGTMFFCIDKTMGMRISEDEEDQGLDVLEHAADPTATWVMRRRYNPADAMAASLWSQGAHERHVPEWNPPAGAAPQDIAPAAVPTDADRQGQ